MSRVTRVRLATATAVAAVVLAVSRDDVGAAWWWVVPAVVATTWALVGAVPAAHAALPPGLLPGLLLGSVVATYGCVPETDHVVWVAIAPITLAVVELRTGRRVRSAWVVGVADLVLWAGVFGATGRESAYVGAWFALWPTFVAAVAAPWIRRLRAPRWLTATIAMAGPVVASGVVARTGALEPTIEPALTAVAIAAPTSAALAALVLVVSTERGADRLSQRLDERGDPPDATRRPSPP